MTDQFPMKMFRNFRRLTAASAFAVFALAALYAAPAAAQNPAVLKAQAAQAESQKQAVAKRQQREKAAALEASGLSAPKIDDLIATLESQDARDRLIRNLKGLRAVSKGEAAVPDEGESGAADIMSGRARIIGLISDRIEAVSAQLVAGAGLLVDAPRLLDWAERQYTEPDKREIWLRVIWKVLLVIAAGFVGEFLLRLLLRGPRSAIEGQQLPSLMVRIPFLLARTVVDIIPIAAFGAAAYIILSLLDPGQVTRLVAIALINASVIARSIMAAARMLFAPRASNLRVLNLSDETANYFVIWTRRFANLVVYGYFLAEAALLLGLPASGHSAVMKVIGLLLVLLAMIFILQNRKSVGDAIRGGQERGSRGLCMMRRRFADVWHALAIVYVFALYLAWELEIRGGFEFVFEATLLSLVILVAAKLIMIASHHAMEAGFGIRQETMDRFPGLAFRANRYFAILHYVINGVVLVLATFAILEAWGVNAFDWVGTPLGRRISGSVISIALVSVLSILFWEMVASVIERYLSRGENGDGDISARARTLLPLLRKASLIIIATIGGFIILSQVGVDIGPLLAGAGVVGLAVGFGSQTLVKDVITGLFILAEDQFAVGDVVRVSDKSGLVEAITIRTIRLRDLAGNVHTIPFSAVTTVENMTKDYSRYVFNVGIAYREDVDEVIQVLRDLGAEMQVDEYYGALINEPLEILGLDSFGDSAIVIKARFTTKPIKQWEVGREFNRRMKRKFDELGIEIPFPHQTVYFGENKGGGAPPAFVSLADNRGGGQPGDAGPSGGGPARTDRVDNAPDDN
jgi:small-conductance mechanosensitive channel